MKYCLFYDLLTISVSSLSSAGGIKKLNGPLMAPRAVVLLMLAVGQPPLFLKLCSRVRVCAQYERRGGDGRPGDGREDTGEWCGVCSA